MLIGVCFCLGLLIAVIVDWLNFYGITGLEIKKYSRAVIFALILIPLADPLTLKKGVRFSLSTPFMMMGFLFLSYALYKRDLAGELYYITRIIFWLAGGFYVHRMLVNGYFPKKIFSLTISTIVVFYFVMVLFTMLNASVRFSQNIAIYTLLWCVPLLMIRKPSKVKTVLIIMASLSIFLAFKRGAMLALILGFLSYIFVWSLQNRSVWNVFKSIFIIILLISTVAMSVYFINIVRPEFFAKRTADLTNKESFGSGRGTFYNVIKDNYINAFNKSPKYFFFGFGSRSVQKLLAEYYEAPEGFGAYAHSDWLQIMHDYGLTGILILLFIHISIIRLLIFNFKAKSKELPAMVMNYTIFLLLNIYSGFFFSPNAIYFSIFMACASGASINLSGNKNSNNHEISSI